MPASYYNPVFKRPDASTRPPPRSPTPPHRFVERLSPTPSKPTPKPAPIEPHFNYPAINNHVDFVVRPEHSYAATPASRGRSNTHQHAHHRTSSNIDTLAEAALGLSPGHQVYTNGAVAGQAPTHPPPSTYGRSEPPHKRARSELLPSPMGMPYASRPATSYENGQSWRRGPAAQRQTGNAYDNRLEEASLLLNFASPTNAWPSRASHLPPPVAPRGDTFSLPRPHANSFPQDVHQPRPIDLATQAGLLPPFNPQDSNLPRPTLPSPQQTIEESESSPNRMEGAEQTCTRPQYPTFNKVQHGNLPVAHAQTERPSSELNSRPASTDVTTSEVSESAPPVKARGWPKGKPRGPSGRKSRLNTERAATKKRPAARKKAAETSKALLCAGEISIRPEVDTKRRNSLSSVPGAAARTTAEVACNQRAQSVPRDTPMFIRPTSVPKQIKRASKVAPETVCAGCATTRETSKLNPEMDQWISCNGCKNWFHVDCAGFKKAVEVRDVDKYFCAECEPVHGKTTYVRKSTRAHASVDYAELQRGVLKTSEESMEHHYIQPIKDGTFQFDPETFPRMRPELITKEFFERGNTFVEPICIPAAWNPRPWADKQERSDTSGTDGPASEDADVTDMAGDDYEYDTVADNGQDKLDMIMPENLTVRQVCNLVGPDTPLDVIDVKTQNSGSKWTLSRWADYYEEDGDEKPIRNVISLEVSQTKLGRLLQRPKIVRDMDLQDEVWPQKEIDQGKWPKVQYYCLMSVADSYTDFHIDFGGSSVYYHILKGKKTFFFIPPKPKHLKAYEEWNDSPQQNYTFLPNITQECYRVDLHEGDTMLIPSGWIHAVWTPETSLVIGGNFLNKLSFKNQFKVAEIEKANETPMKFRYPFFQRIMWYTAIKYMKDDPLPEAVAQLFYEGKRFERSIPVWADFDGDVAANDDRPGANNARYYGQAEIDGLPDLVNFIFRTVMMVMGRVEGITADRMKRVNASIPKVAGEPLEVAKTFALWVAWKRGNEDPPAWAHPDAVLPAGKEEGPPKKLSARALKEMERKSAIAAIPPERASARVKKAVPPAASSGPVVATSTSIPPDRAPSYPPPSQPSTTSAFAPQNTVHHQSVPAPMQMAPPANVMDGAYISTPKTSVLGPKRVACDTCRKRRIRCKHKDLVMQAPPDGANPTQQVSPETRYAVLAPEPHDNINVTPPKPYATSSFYANSFHVQQNGSMHALQNGPTSNGFSVMDGRHAMTPARDMNGYMNHHATPLTANGLHLNGDLSKRGRSKACFECRKSKRRCIHDENGNVDPTKAAEPPVPRGSATSKKRPSEDGTPVQSKKKPKLEHSSNEASLHPVQHPSTPNAAVQHAQAAPNDAYSKQHYSSTASTGNVREQDNGFHAQQQQHSQPPIDPSLFGYTQAMQNGTYDHASYQYSSSGPYPAAERPPLYQLPSLEQIANDVLDFNGDHHEHEQAQEIPQHPQENGHVYEVANGLPNGVHSSREARPDESVDSAVSLPPSEDGKQSIQDVNGVATEHVEVQEAVGASLKTPNGDSTADVPDQQVRAPAHGNAVQPTVEAPQSRSPVVQKSAIESLPLYRPPAPLSQSPELAKRQPQLTNGTATHTNPPKGTPPNNKRKRESMSRTPGSKNLKKVRVTAGADPPAQVEPVNGEDRESLELARALQQDDLGLRRRRE